MHRALALLLLCKGADAKKSLPTPGWGTPCSDTLQSERTNAVFSCTGASATCESSFVRVFACDRGRPCRRRGLDWVASDHQGGDQAWQASDQSPLWPADYYPEAAQAAAAPSCEEWCNEYTCDSPSCTTCSQCAAAQDSAGDDFFSSHECAEWCSKWTCDPKDANNVHCAGCPECRSAQHVKARTDLAKKEREEQLTAELPADAGDDVYILCEPCGKNCCREAHAMLVCHSPAPPPPPPVPQPPPKPPPNPPPPRTPPPPRPLPPPPWEPALMPPQPPLWPPSPPPPPPPLPPPRAPPGFPPAAPPTLNAVVRQNLQRLESALPPKTQAVVRQWRYSSALLVALAAGVIVYIATRLVVCVVCGRRHKRVLSSAVDDDDGGDDGDDGDDDDDDDDDDDEHDNNDGKGGGGDRADVDVEEGKRGNGDGGDKPRPEGKGTWSGKHVKSDTTASAGEGVGTTTPGDVGSDAERGDTTRQAAATREAAGLELGVTARMLPPPRSAEEERAARNAAREAFRQQVLERAQQKMAVASAVERAKGGS